MTQITIKNMIDNIEVALYFFRVINPDNFYNKDKGTPLIDTLKDFSCYATIPNDNEFHAYWLRANLRTTLGYKPKVAIKDIPFATGKRFCLIVNVSLPKVLFASNIFEINEEQWREVIDAIYNELLHFGVEISKKELEETSNIRRIDFCKNVIIETPVEEFIASLQKLKKTRAKTFKEHKETIYFNTRKKKSCIYDKICEVISKASSNKNDVTYKLAQELKTLQAFSNIHVIRVEQRLIGLSAIKQELKSLIEPQDITLKSLFSKKIASYVLYKHWIKIATEERFKTLLLGEKEVNVILSALAKIAQQQKLKNVNPIFPIYSKLLAEVGEEAANKAIKGMRKPRTLVNYKNELYALVRLLPLYNRRLNDYRSITSAIENWERFSLPINLS